MSNRISHYERARTFLHLAEQLLAAADREVSLAIEAGELPAPVVEVEAGDARLVTLNRVDALDATGSVSYAVAVNGLPVGYVGDSRELGRAGRLVRRWFACASITGDPATVAAAMWDSGPAYRTRAAAVTALVDHVQGVAR